MLAFACPVCEHLVTFESSRCLNCSTELGFDPSMRSMRAVGSGAPGSSEGRVGSAGSEGSGSTGAPVGSAGSEATYRCANARLVSCNWLVRQEGALCASCALTRTRPNDADDEGIDGFADAEAAKRRLLFELAELRLPVIDWQQQRGGLAFDLLSSEQQPVTTGHADGVITLDLHETDPVHRERMRVHLEEPYRTVLGHLRHEIAHYYQPILVAPGSAAELRCRELFGDEREDYQAAIDRYYELGAPPCWEQGFVSAYATMHPWEDWAESFAHYLHVRDTLQTAAAYGMRVEGPPIATADRAPLHSRPDGAPEDIHSVLEAWIPLTYALNAVSRSMGAPDLYPFILGPAIEAKLAFIDELVRAAH